MYDIIYCINICIINIYIYIGTREIPAFGGISLALRGSGAFSVTSKAPPAPNCRRLGRR